MPGYEQFQKAESHFEQLYNQPVPEIEIPFLHDPETTSTTSAPGDISQSSVQAGHKSRIAKGPRKNPMQIWPNSPVGGLPLARKGQGPIRRGIGPRGKRPLHQSIGVAKSLLGMS